MALLASGSLGNFRGKIGRVVVSRWRNKLTARQAPSTFSVSRSPEQLNIRQKMGRVSSFLRMFSSQIDIGWSSGSRHKTPFSEAVGYHMRHAVAGCYPEYHINYQKIMLSRGRGIIDGGFQPLAAPAADCSVKISWTISNSTDEITRPEDHLFVIFLDENIRPNRVRPIFYEDCARRDELSVTVALPEICIDHPLHAYMFFVSEDRKLTSVSEYLGIVTPG
jgi:hypothetical protein